MVDITKKKLHPADVIHPEVSVLTMSKTVEWTGVCKIFPYTFKLIHKIGSAEITVQLKSRDNLWSGFVTYTYGKSHANTPFAPLIAQAARKQYLKDTKDEKVTIAERLVKKAEKQLAKKTSQNERPSE